MAQARATTLAVSRFVLAFVGALLIVRTFPVLAQVPSFQPAVTYGSGGYEPIAAALGDLNGDGILDAVVANRCVEGYTCPDNAVACPSSDYCSHGAIGVLLGNGDGTFQPAVTYGTNGYLSSSVALGDLNGDGTIDLVVTNHCGAVPIDSDSLNCPYSAFDIMFGNGDGTFGPPFSGTLKGRPVSVALGDLNGDGKPEMVVADICFACSYEGCTCTAGSVEVVLGRRYDSGAPFGLSAALGDVNRDGKLDVLVGNLSYVGVLLGNGDGTLQPAVLYSSGGYTAVADVNSDGKPDLVSVSGMAKVLLGNGDGTFNPAVTYPTGGLDSRSVSVADVNGDGISDLVVPYHNGFYRPHGVGVLTGNGDGSFRPAVTFDSGGYWSAWLAVGDLNRDGKPDLVTVNVGGLGVGVLLNNAPVCMAPPMVTISADPPFLWPPNGNFVPVTVSGTITDAGVGCTPKTAAYAVTDKYGEVQPTGPVTFGPGGAYSFRVLLPASRLGADLDGRIYTVTVSASNDADKMGSQAAAVIVPHDKRH